MYNYKVNEIFLGRVMDEKNYLVKPYIIEEVSENILKCKECERIHERDENLLLMFQTYYRVGDIKEDTNIIFNNYIGEDLEGKKIKVIDDSLIYHGEEFMEIFYL